MFLAYQFLKPVPGQQNKSTTTVPFFAVFLVKLVYKHQQIQLDTGLLSNSVPPLG